MEKEVLEIERKFLIELPLTWFGKFKVRTAQKEKIFQTYLAEPGIENSRVRAIFHDDRYISPIYKYTRKLHLSKGINKEYEVDLTVQEYRDKLAVQDSTRNRICKTRYIIPFDNRKFELDIFEDILCGLAILEIELESMKADILLPPYFKVLKEVTDDKFFSNRNLATLDIYNPTR